MHHPSMTMQCTDPLGWVRESSGVISGMSGGGTPIMSVMVPHLNWLLAIIIPWLGLGSGTAQTVHDAVRGRLFHLQSGPALVDGLAPKGYLGQSDSILSHSIIEHTPRAHKTIDKFNK